MKKEKLYPPKLALHFFRWYCKPGIVDSIEGDLLEVYKRRENAKGKLQADIRFVWDVLVLCRPGIIRSPKTPQKLNPYGMYKSYFTVGWRNLLRNKGYSVINIGGLSTGMAITILIALWIWGESSFDKQCENYEQVARVMQHQTVDGRVGSQTAIPRPLEFALRERYGADFKYLSMATWTGDHILTFGAHSISQSGNYVQKDFPEMFSLDMISGSRLGLKDPASILLSASAAKALFGSMEPLNRQIQIDNDLLVTVTGIYEDLPRNSSFNNLKFISSWELFVSNQDWVEFAATQWDNNSFQLFVEVASTTDVRAVSEKIKTVRADITKDVKYKPEVYLHAMSDWHLRSRWENGVNTGGRIQMVWMFGIVGVFVLLLACINFMNLSTARSEKRAKEVGIRMTIGSIRSQLINQFLSESFLVVFISFFVALLMVNLVLPWFNSIADIEIKLIWNNGYFWMFATGFILVTSLLAGSYPALYLSSFRPVQVLKSSFKSGRFSALPRKILVVVQFTVSVSLVIGTLVVYEQIQYTKNRSMGYDSNGLIMIQMKSPEFFNKNEILRTELLNTGAVEEMSLSSSPMNAVWQNSGGFNWKGKNPETQSADFGTVRISHEYGKTVNWKVVEGRDFSREFASDSSAILLNEAGVEFIGTSDPIGMEITWGDTKFHVIGVVQNLIMESPYNPVRPNIYLLDSEHVNWIDIKMNPERSVSESLTAIEGVFKKLVPSAPFDFKFVDDEYERKFRNEQSVGKLAYIFAALATLISCLGLIGLASFVAEQHTKEIGIRKVLGASIAQLWKLLSGNFVILVLISCAVAIPLSYYFMSNWLLNFKYHTDIPWMVFIITIAGAISVTLLTVSYQALKAALANPIKSLRSE